MALRLWPFWHAIVAGQRQCNCWLATASQVYHPLKFYETDGKTIAKPPPRPNFFELMDVEETFDLDGRRLGNTFRRLQAVFHPDKQVGKAKEEQAFAEEWSSHVNNAYNHLLKPLSRALYLLEVKGHPLEEANIADDPAFLADVMDLNEEVAEAESLADLATLSTANKKAMEKYAEDISEAFSEGDVKAARRLVAQFKYFSNLQDKIGEREDQMGAPAPP